MTCFFKMAEATNSQPILLDSSIEKIQIRENKIRYNKKDNSLAIIQQYELTQKSGHSLNVI